MFYLGFPGGSTGKESTCNAGGLGLIPGLGRSPGERNGYPLQYSGLEDSMDCIVLGGHKESDTTERLSQVRNTHSKAGLVLWGSQVLHRRFRVMYGTVMTSLWISCPEPCHTSQHCCSLSSTPSSVHLQSWMLSYETGYCLQRTFHLREDLGDVPLCFNLVPISVSL